MASISTRGPGRTYAGPTSWLKVGTGLNGTTKGTIYGTVGPDYAAKPTISAFYLNGYLYSGRTESANTIKGVWKGAAAGSAVETTLEFSVPPLNYNTGKPTTTSGQYTLMTTDGDRIYSIAYSRGLGYNGYRVREFTTGGTFIADHDIGNQSYYIDGVMCDGSSLYLIEWAASDSAQIVKVSLASWSMSNVWTINQGATYVISGCYDDANKVFWMGRLSGGSEIRRYSRPGLDLRDNPERLYEKMGATNSFDDSLSYYFKVVPYNANGDASISSCATATVILPNRTLRVNDDPRHTVHDLGEIARHPAEATLDRGALSLSSTDLSVASWGPMAQLSRVYSSESTASTSFGPGWMFNFESRLETSAGRVTYVDQDGERHPFVASGATITDTGVRTTSAQLNSNSWARSLVRDSRGNLHAVYQDAPANKVYYVMSTNQGATWSTPEEIGSSSTFTINSPPVLKIDGNDRIHVLWQLYVPDDIRLNHRYRDYMGAWSAVNQVGAGHSAADEVELFANPAIDPTGVLQLVFDRCHWRGLGLRTFSAGTWSGTTGVVGGMSYDQAYHNTVPIGSDLYTFFRRYTDGYLYMAKRVAGVWSGPTLVSAVNTTYHNEIVDSDGKIWAFNTNMSGSPLALSYAVYTPSTATWSSWTTLDSEPATSVYLPSATTDAAGNIWVFYNVGNEIAYRVFNRATQTWSARTKVTDASRDGVCVMPQARYQAYSHAEPSKIELAFRQNNVGDSSTYRLYYASVATATAQQEYLAPNGYYGTLTNEAYGYKLAFKDGQYLRFDAGGKLLAEGDKNAQEVTYTWTGGTHLAIRAANTQSIEVTFSAGTIESAQYATSAGVRRIDYAGGSTPRVTYYPGTSEAYAIRYDYAGGRLASLAVETQGGAQVSMAGVSALWGFGYDGSNRLSQVRYPGYATNANKRADISYATSSATISTYGEVDGTAGTITRVYGWNPTGTMSSRTEPKIASETTASWSYVYAPTNEVIAETGPLGLQRENRIRCPRKRDRARRPGWRSDIVHVRLL